MITGCTGGIGQAYATELAAAGCNLILVSRSESKLKKFAQTVGKFYQQWEQLSENENTMFVIRKHPLRHELELCSVSSIFH